MTKLIRLTALVIVLLLLKISPSTAKQDRNLLAGDKGVELLKNNLILNDQWVSFPEYKNRKAWEQLPANIRKEYILEGEKYLDYSWPAIPASSYLDYVRTGSRDIMQKPYNERLKAFRCLVMAELMEGKGRFLDQIINGIWVYCQLLLQDSQQQVYVQR